MTDSSIRECDSCGEEIWISGRAHARYCTGDGEQKFSGSCPMCGGSYDDYFQHLKTCGARTAE
jgi:hypothetical protein